jgi:16S rRNA (guanine966-N2)-methyltransferase
VTRIIAGSHGGRRLRTPGQKTTRPTTDRVREAAFSAIADWAGTGGQPAERALAGLGFLDLFAGSAAIALEAASRGAAPVVAVEGDHGAAAVARANAASLGLPVEVASSTVGRWLAGRAASGFDIVWADPPYDLSGERLGEIVSTVVSEGWLIPGGLLVLERSSRDPAPPLPVTMTLSWHRRYGETMLYFAMEDKC